MGDLRGYHFTISGSGVTCHPGDIARFLDCVVDTIGMSKIAEPTIRESYGNGFQLIAESHVSVHIQGGAAQVHVFSCKQFDPAPVMVLLQEIFGGDWSGLFFSRSVRDGQGMRDRRYFASHAPARSSG